MIEFVRQQENVGFLEACERLEAAPPEAGGIHARPGAARASPCAGNT